MTNRILVASLGLIIAMANLSLAQEKSPASPSDIPIDKIKLKGTQPAAKPQAADSSKATDAAAPAPEQATASSDTDCEASCSRCGKTDSGCGKGRLLARLRSLLGRCCR